MTISSSYDSKKKTFEAALELTLPLQSQAFAEGEIPSKLAEAMRYSLLAGGKRVRPVLFMQTVEMLGGDMQEAMPFACALEMIHTYSLIHDDLPGLDDDDLRRGMPTNHKVYGVGMAILAGDGLLNGAYELLLKNALRYPHRVQHHVEAMAEIGRRAGITGMIAGQCLDVLSEGQEGEAGEPLLRYIHHHKTADLLTAALTSAGFLCGAPVVQVAALERYGMRTGLAFQIIDDLLDEEGDSAQLGKNVGMDSLHKKLTWPALLGKDAARHEAERLMDEAKRALSVFGDHACELVLMAEQLLRRTA